MANRQALRELQDRLAARLQAARTEGVSVAWLAAELGGKRFLFPLGQAGEIFPWTPVQAVPYTQAWYLGVANLRGGLSGVVDLALFSDHAAGLPEPSGARQETSGESSLLVFNPALGVQCALVIDRLAGLRGGEAFVAAEPPPQPAPAWFGHVYTDAAGLPWQEIDLQALSQHPSFLSISG